MILGTWSKQPAESWVRGIDFVQQLQVGETISVGAVTSKNAATGADTTATIVSGPTVNGTKVEARLAAGTSGETHVVQFRATTSLGNVYEDEARLVILET